MLYSFSKDDTLLPLSDIMGLVFREIDDPFIMAGIGQIALEEAENRFANGNKAYVAFLDKQPASFGWVATGKARIGELNHAFILPERHRYLWNFRTLPAFRGLGIYPRLLQYIIHSEFQEAHTFWIMHAPENKASEQGIRKAGFKWRGRVSAIYGKDIIFDAAPGVELTVIETALGFRQSAQAQASCWNCSSPYLSKRKMECCCMEDTLCTYNLLLSLA